MLELLKTAACLAVVLGLAYAVLRVLKRIQVPEAAPEELRFVKALPVGPRERIVVVAWRGQALLVGVTAGAIHILDRGAIPASNANAPAARQDAAPGPADRDDAPPGLADLLPRLARIVRRRA
jgi:flagellar biogenesis protein FliO